jgi:hypothetical protein
MMTITMARAIGPACFPRLMLAGSFTTLLLVVPALLRVHDDLDFLRQVQEPNVASAIDGGVGGIGIGIGASLASVERNSGPGEREANCSCFSFEPPTANRSSSRRRASTDLPAPKPTMGLGNDRGLLRQDACCQRLSLTTHKMGTFLTNGFFRDIGEIDRLVDVSPHFYPRGDYRHVVMARNLYESIVSGYLYHRAGHECWLTGNGKRYDEVGKPNRTVDWERNVRRSGYDLPPYPPRMQRSICQYLAEESSQVGMTVYMAWVLRRWYGGMVTYWEQARRQEERDGFPKTLFVCLEEAGDPGRQEAVFERMIDWFFPSNDGGKGRRRYEFPEGLRRSENAAGYSGGHSTPRIPTERKRLRNLARRLDREIFRGDLAVIQSRYRCGGAETEQEDEYE